MKILQVTNFFKPSFEAGGVARVAYSISKCLIKQGHNVTVFTTNRSLIDIDVETNKPLDVEGMKVYYFENLRKYFSVKIPPIPYYLPFIVNKKIKDFDIIHIHEHRTLLAIIVHHYAKKYDVPYVIQPHGSVLPFFQKQGLKKVFDCIFGNRILNDASKVIAVSNTEVEQYVKINVPNEKITIVPNGLDNDAFNNLPENGTFRTKTGLSNDYIILFLGRLNKIKGIDFLIKSYAQLNKEMDDVVLVLAGPDGGYKHEAELLINELGLTNNVIFTDHLGLEDKLAAYVDADVLVYPSIFEIFGLVPFEAILSGTPVIVTDDCGCGELVKDAECGCLVKYGDIEGLKNTMMSLIRNPDVGANMVNNGKMYITNNLSYDIAIKSLEGIYEDCIHNV